jgi:hypothetical protein
MGNGDPAAKGSHSMAQPPVEADDQAPSGHHVQNKPGESPSSGVPPNMMAVTCRATIVSSHVALNTQSV